MVMNRAVLIGVALLLALSGCQSEEDEVAAALHSVRLALRPFAAAAPYIPLGTPDDFPVMCMPVVINGEYLTDYCLDAGEFRAAAEALNLIEEVD